MQVGQDLRDARTGLARWPNARKVPPHHFDAQRRQAEPLAGRRPPRLFGYDSRDLLKLALRESGRVELHERTDARVSIILAESRLRQSGGARQGMRDANHLRPTLGVGYGREGRPIPNLGGPRAHCAFECLFRVPRKM